ncbi:hypothetical protein D6C77_09651 [Aureobasidium pullulans]|nr:hypothetical protein D6C77_09651 [Aureobasidium pullulans]
MDDLEATQPYISAPWDARPDTVDDTDDGLQVATKAQGTQGIRITTSASVRNRLVGIGGAVESIDRIRNHTARHEYDKTLGTISQSDAYTAALASIEEGLSFVVGAVYAGALSARVHGEIIHVFTNNRTVLITLRASPRRTRQWIIGGILKHIEFLKGFGIRVVFAWAPLLTQATAHVPTTIGDAVRRIDAGWPGGHTRRMYDELSKRQASVVAQLRTGMTPLNGYLHNIKAAESNLCECGEAVESREHFIFHCVRWSEQREILGVWTGEEDLSRLLGGKTATDNGDWTPDMDAVRAVVHFTLATKRFERDSSARGRTTT